MKYTVSIEVELPRDRVAQLLADPVHLPKWLRGLVVHEPISGVHGRVGAVSRVVLRMGDQEFEGTETVTTREPADLHEIPEGAVVRFEREIVGKGMWSAARERLSVAGPQRTLWESDNEYRFSSLGMRLVGLLMPGVSASSRCGTCGISRPSRNRGRTSATDPGQSSARRWNSRWSCHSPAMRK